MKMVRFNCPGGQESYSINRSNIVGFETFDQTIRACNVLLDTGATIFINGLTAQEAETVLLEFDSLI